MPTYQATGKAPNPTDLTVHQRSRVLDIVFDDGSAYAIPFELLRVYSPSAEVRGHGAGQETLQTGKREVGIEGVEPVGNYAVRPIFTDGHNSGLYTWEYLHWLGANAQVLWQDYLGRLQAAGHPGESGRDAPMPQMGSGACGHKH